MKRDYSLFGVGSILNVNIVGNQFTGEVVLSFSSIKGDIRKSYVNSQITQEGGAHVEGLMKGGRRALKRILEEYGNKLMPGDVLEHLFKESGEWYNNIETILRHYCVSNNIDTQFQKNYNDKVRFYA